MFKSFLKYNHSYSINKINFVIVIFVNKLAGSFTNLCKVSIKSLLMMGGYPDSKGFFYYPICFQN